MADPFIIYIPGLLPKPEPELHREALNRCLLSGLRRVDASVADAVGAGTGNFDIVSWTYDFYGTHCDIGLDKAAIEAVIDQPAASASDMRKHRPGCVALRAGYTDSVADCRS